LALAISIALNEIVIGLLHRSPPAVETHVEPTIITIAHRTPAPTPPPTPVPTPPPRVVHFVPHVAIARYAQVAAPRTKAPKETTHGGSVSRRATAVADVYAELSHNALGHGTGIAGSGTGTGVGPGNGGGDAGNGQGNGTGGNGTGDVNTSAEPCGNVDFNTPAYTPQHGTTYYETVDATVHFPDGHTEDAEFPYKWKFPNGERTDPWSATNLKEHPDDFPIPAQTPPPNVDPSSLSPVLQYILQHTDERGHTVLKPCPKAK